MNLTGKQILLIVSAVLSALVAASAQLTDIFGPTVAKSIISVISLFNTILTSITAALSGQANLVQDVRAMPGVEHIEVNEKANPTLAKLAIDPNEPKIAPSQKAAAAVEATAKGEPTNA